MSLRARISILLGYCERVGLLTIKNNDGFNAKEVAEYTIDNAVCLALYPDNEQSEFAKLAAIVVSFLLYIVAWVNAALNRAVRQALG